MKYLRIHSDLHLEQWYGMPAQKLADRLIPQHENDGDSILILAGDISSKIDQLLEFLNTLARFSRVVYIPGNHEFYGHDLNNWETKVAEGLKSLPNVLCPLTGVEAFEFDSCQIIAGTLWADGGKDEAERVRVETSLRDFYVTAFQGERWTVDSMRKINKVHHDRIDELLKAQSDKVRIVVTHHMPSYRLCHPRFGNEINGGFACNCEDILAYDHAPDLWIHGHTHDFIDTKLWKTTVICNPSGYRSEHDNGFSSAGPFFVEI